MDHSPNEAPQNAMSNTNGLCSGIISSWLTSSASRICSYQQVDDHRKSRRPTYKTIKQADRVRQSHKDFIKQSYLRSQSHIHTSPKHVMAFQINTLRLDSTHPDTYNLVRFNGCLHMWWIPLLTPELCVTGVTMNQFSLTTRLVLNEFQASCYSHHRSQSALGEIFRVVLQWSGRNPMAPVSGCPWWCPICITR